MSPALALNTFLTLALASVERPPPGTPVEKLGALRTGLQRAAHGRCDGLGVRLAAHDGAEVTRIQIVRGEVAVARFPAEGPPRLWRSALRPDDCHRVARQLASRFPTDARWPKLEPRLDAPAGGEGDTALRLAVPGATLKVRVAEDDVQEVGFVAMARGELLRLAAVLSGGEVRR